MVFLFVAEARSFDWPLNPRRCVSLPKVTEACPLSSYSVCPTGPCTSLGVMGCRTPPPLSEEVSTSIHPHAGPESKVQSWSDAATGFVPQQVPNAGILCYTAFLCDCIPDGNGNLSCVESNESTRYMIFQWFSDPLKPCTTAEGS